VSEARGARVTFRQLIRLASSGALLCEGRAEVACMDAARGKPRRWPEDLLVELVK
jgi:acyl-CoA thioesterase FadM